MKSREEMRREIARIIERDLKKREITWEQAEAEILASVKRRMKERKRRHLRVAK